MTKPSVYLNQIRTIRPAFEKKQEDALSWLAQAHMASEVFSGSSNQPSERTFDYFLKIVRRFGCSSDKIGFRGHELEDFNHTEWARMKVFCLQESASGLPMQTRQNLFSELVRGKCDFLFPDHTKISKDILHVTCTGYVSPSPLQRFVVDVGLGERTRVFHAYHMGCYAALPATRIASALALQNLMQANSAEASGVDVVHTEMCTLHFNPSDHSPEQLVVQSLFADGFVKYRLSVSNEGESRSFRLSAMSEIQIPHSAHAMTWIPTSWGMAMTLSRDVPALIAAALKGYVADLMKRAGLLPEMFPDLVFAVHPGGPKIIEYVQSLLEINDNKIAASKAVLFKYGNMSSATLPHIWKEILDDTKSYPAGTFVLSLAFGPGLTIAGHLMEIV